MLGLLTGCGADESCEQDYPPPIQITTSQNTYTIDYNSTDLAISEVRWENPTTGGSGVATIDVYKGCFPIFGCGTGLAITMDIPLAAGENTVYVFERSGGCEWRSDYVISRT